MTEWIFWHNSDGLSYSFKNPTPQARLVQNTGDGGHIQGVTSDCCSSFSVVVGLLAASLISFLLILSPSLRVVLIFAITLRCYIFSSYWWWFWQCSLSHAVSSMFFYTSLLTGTFQQFSGPWLRMQPKHLSKYYCNSWPSSVFNHNRFNWLAGACLLSTGLILSKTGQLHGQLQSCLWKGVQTYQGQVVVIFLI